MAIAILAVLLIAGCTSSSDSENEASVNTVSIEAGGWNFTADLEGPWQTNPSIKAEDGDSAGWESRNTDYLIEHNMDSDSPNFYNWEGSIFENVFWLPKKGAVIDPENVPDILSLKQNELLANVDIRVYKVPEEVREWDTHDILMDLYGFESKTDDVEDTEFNDRPALIIENDQKETSNDKGEVIIPECSIGTFLILITDDTVVELDVVTLPESDLSARDVIDSFRISPA
jgi:hypothetical protein